jgi:ABC-2 type transport system permease protein
MSALMALVRKDIAQFVSNRRALIMSLAAPIAIAAMVGYLFSPKSSKPTRVPVAISDLDRSPLSREIVTALSADTTLKVQEMSPDEADAAVREGKVRATVQLPAGFGAAAPRAMFGGTAKPVVEIRHDPSQPMALALVQGLLSQQVMQAVSKQSFSGAGMANMRRDMLSSGLPADRQRDLQALFDSVEKVQGPASAASAAPAASAGGMSAPFATHTQEAVAGNGEARRYNAFSHAFAGMGVQFILFAGIEFGTALLLARRMGLWKRLRVAPISRSTLLGSRIASGAVISLALLLLIFAAGMALFGVRIEGSVVGFVGIGIAFSAMTASFGMLIAALGRSPEATRGLAIFATLMMVMLGGAWLPSFMFPEWLQTASLAIPTRWAVDGLDAMTWRGLGLEAAWAPIAALLGFAALFSAVAVWRFEWEE